MIETERLILRGWRDGDAVPFHAMSQDPEVMRFLGPPLTRAQCAEAVARQRAKLAANRFCFWALETKAEGAFIGFCGVQPAPSGTPIADQIEIGWRLARPYWGKGLANEAASAALEWTWGNTDAPLVAAITATENTRSRKLMERLGMLRHADEDFDHPALAEGDPLRRHVVYRMDRPPGR